MKTQSPPRLFKNLRPRVPCFDPPKADKAGTKTHQKPRPPPHQRGRWSAEGGTEGVFILLPSNPSGCHGLLAQRQPVPFAQHGGRCFSVPKAIQRTGCEPAAEQPVPRPHIPNTQSPSNRAPARHRVSTRPIPSPRSSASNIGSSILITAPPCQEPGADGSPGRATSTPTTTTSSRHSTPPPPTFARCTTRRRRTRARSASGIAPASPNSTRFSSSITHLARINTQL